MPHFPTAGITSQDYRYYEAFPHTWSEDLEQLSKGGVRHLNLSVPWGIHEPLRGHCDFQKSARLRLEKFFSIAQERGIQINLRLSLSGKKGALPEWAEQDSRRSSSPYGLWEGAPSGFVTRGTSAITTPEVLEGFVDFCQQLFSLISLYSVPDGPVENISLDLAEYLFALVSPDESEIMHWWESRFVTPGEFNRVFGMAFSTFSAAATSLGLRQLVERRPWLCAFEFRKYLDEKVERLRARIVLEAAKHQIDHLLKKQLANASDTHFLIEDCDFLTRSGFLFPLSPWGVFSESMAKSFGSAEMLWDGILANGYTPQPFSEFSTCASGSSMAIVFCGKNISRAMSTRLISMMSDGLRVFFPFGPPIYDERMLELPWLTQSKQEPFPAGELRLYRRTIGAGGLYYPAASMTPESFGRTSLSQSLAQIIPVIQGQTA